MATSSLPKLPPEAIRLAHCLETFFQTEKSWILLHPDQRALITFIAQNYEIRSTVTKSAQSDNNLACYPRIWAQKEYRVKKSIQRTADLAWPLLKQSCPSYFGAKSILHLPVELIILIGRNLSDNELYNLCRTNRGLYHFLSRYLRRRGMQDLRALKHSLQRNKKIAFIKAIEAVSDVPETARNKSRAQLYPLVNNRNVQLIQLLVSRDGILGCALRKIIQRTLHHMRYETWVRPERGDWRSTETCLKWGADPNYRFEDGSSWMSHVIKSSIVDTGHGWGRDVSQEKQERVYREVKLLLSHGADPNSVGSLQEMDSMLHLACLYHQPQTLRALLEAGADPNAKDARGRTPLHKLFEQHKRKDGSKSSDWDTLVDVLLADRRVKIDERDNYGCTPLSVAASWKCSCWCNVPVLKFAKRIVRMPEEADINSQDSLGKTPLCCCIGNNKRNMTRLLLAQHRLDPNLGPADEFPLLLAVSLNQQETVELLLQSKRLDINKQTSQGQTALLKAIDVRNKETIDMLAKAGANPDIGMSEGKTARQRALAAGIRIKWKTFPV